MSHIINFAAQVLLLRDVPNIIDAKLYLARALEQEQKKLEIRHQKRHISKLHNIVKYIRQTFQQPKQFFDTSIGDQLNDVEFDDLMVKSNNATR